MTTFDLTPSFARAIEAEAACVPVGTLPFWQRVAGFLGLIVLFVLSLVLLDAVFGQTDSAARVSALFLAAMSYLVFGVILTRMSGAHVQSLQVVAREKGAPWTFHFSEGGFDIHGSNTRSHYEWSAIDEVVPLRAGTGLRVGAWVFPVADADLPEGMDRAAFTRAIAQWRQA